MIYLAMLAAREAIAVSRFSPLAGIRYAETLNELYSDFVTNVSVPLRGLDMRKPHSSVNWWWNLLVSVPLRGLDMRKLKSKLEAAIVALCFSPLAGIRYAETLIVD